MRRAGFGLLLLLAVAGIAIGGMRGEMQTVLTKSVYICLECIGIG